MKALVLAGGFPQIALIQELKKRGIYTVLADYYEEPVAKPYADKFYRTSTLDVDSIKDIAVNEKVDFLITACTDQALLTVALVSEQLSLPCYIDYKTALNVTNKSYMKKVFVENNIPTAQHFILSELDFSLISHLEYPLIVKPVDCNSSKGVKKAFNEKELKEAFADAVNFSRTNTAIIEEFMEGQEITADIYVENGTAKLLSIANSDKIADQDKFVIWRTRYPADEASEHIDNLVAKTAQQIADAFGITDAPMLVQMITDGKKVSVLEFSARTGGGVKYRLIHKVSGVDVISAVVDLTLGIKPDIEVKPPENKYISNEFIYCKPGKFDHFEGFEEMKQQGIISEYFLFKWKGAEFDKVENSGDRVGVFTIQADTPEEMIRKHRTALDNIKVVDADGNNIMRYDLFTDWFAAK
ncbi:MAG: ATP-grasp domain-containing protein [Clostridia bacterium]|nr:ATP-grasp domain-containing protein [Clostridia bacterium]